MICARQRKTRARERRNIRKISRWNWVKKEWRENLTEKWHEEDKRRTQEQKEEEEVDCLSMQRHPLIWFRRKTLTLQVPERLPTAISSLIISSSIFVVLANSEHSSWLFETKHPPIQFSFLTMTSATLPRRAPHLQSIRGSRNNHHCNSDDEDTHGILPSSSRWSAIKQSKTSSQTTSSDEGSYQPAPSPSPNRFKEICSRLKRRLSLNKEHRPASDDIRGSLVERRRTRSGNYKSFSSSVDDDCFNEFKWPDFEQVYESIPRCLINALPGLDDFTLEEYDEEISSDHYRFHVDENEQASIEQMNSFAMCRRGQHFRRDAICQKLDKCQYRGQLDTFIQQLMIEKLMRTWSWLRMKSPCWCRCVVVRQIYFNPIDIEIKELDFQQIFSSLDRIEVTDRVPVSATRWIMSCCCRFKRLCRRSIIHIETFPR